MRTSLRYLDLNYIKILPITTTPTTAATVAATIKPKQAELNAFQKQFLRRFNYYENNKEKILNKQKEYIIKILNED